MNLEDYVRFFHANCGGIVVGSLETGKFRCAECGREMTAFVSAEEEKHLEDAGPLDRTENRPAHRFPLTILAAFAIASAAALSASLGHP
jgi:hypothetical protein